MNDLLVGAPSATLASPRRSDTAAAADRHSPPAGLDDEDDCAAAAFKMKSKIDAEATDYSNGGFAKLMNGASLKSDVSSSSASSTASSSSSSSLLTSQDVSHAAHNGVNAQIPVNADGQASAATTAGRLEETENDCSKVLLSPSDQAQEKFYDVTDEDNGREELIDGFAFLSFVDEADLMRVFALKKEQYTLRQQAASIASNYGKKPVVMPAATTTGAAVEPTSAELKRQKSLASNVSSQNGTEPSAPKSSKKSKSGATKSSIKRLNSSSSNSGQHATTNSLASISQNSNSSYGCDEEVTDVNFNEGHHVAATTNENHTSKLDSDVNRGSYDEEVTRSSSLSSEHREEKNMNKKSSSSSSSSTSSASIASIKSKSSEPAAAPGSPKASSTAPNSNQTSHSPKSTVTISKEPSPEPVKAAPSESASAARSTPSNDADIETVTAAAAAAAAAVQRAALVSLTNNLSQPAPPLPPVPASTASANSTNSTPFPLFPNIPTLVTESIAPPGSSPTSKNWPTPTSKPSTPGSQPAPQAGAAASKPPPALPPNPLDPYSLYYMPPQPQHRPQHPPSLSTPPSLKAPGSSPSPAMVNNDHLSMQESMNKFMEICTKNALAASGTTTNRAPTFNPPSPTSRSKPPPLNLLPGLPSIPPPPQLFPIPHPQSTPSSSSSSSSSSSKAPPSFAAAPVKPSKNPPSPKSLGNPNGSPFPLYASHHLSKNAEHLLASQYLHQHQQQLQHNNHQQQHQQQQQQHHQQLLQNSYAASQTKPSKPSPPSPGFPHHQLLGQHQQLPPHHLYPGGLPLRTPEPHLKGGSSSSSSNNGGGIPTSPFLPGIKNPLDSANHANNLKLPPNQLPPQTPPYNLAKQPSSQHNPPPQQSLSHSQNSLHAQQTGAHPSKHSLDMFSSSSQKSASSSSSHPSQSTSSSSSRHNHPNMLNPLAGFLPEFAGVPGGSAMPGSGGGGASHSLPPTGHSPYNIPGFDPALLGLGSSDLFKREFDSKLLQAFQNEANSHNSPLFHPSSSSSAAANSNFPSNFFPNFLPPHLSKGMNPGASGPATNGSKDLKQQQQQQHSSNKPPSSSSAASMAGNPFLNDPQQAYILSQLFRNSGYPGMMPPFSGVPPNSSMTPPSPSALLAQSQKAASISAGSMPPRKESKDMGKPLGSSNGKMGGPVTPSQSSPFSSHLPSSSSSSSSSSSKQPSMPGMSPYGAAFGPGSGAHSLPPHLGGPPFGGSSPFNLGSLPAPIPTNSKPPQMAPKLPKTASSSSLAGSRSGVRWCDAHVRIARMIMLHQQQKRSGLSATNPGGLPPSMHSSKSASGRSVTPTSASAAAVAHMQQKQSGMPGSSLYSPFALNPTPSSNGKQPQQQQQHHKQPPHQFDQFGIPIPPNAAATAAAGLGHPNHHQSSKTASAASTFFPPALLAPPFQQQFSAMKPHKDVKLDASKSGGMNPSAAANSQQQQQQQMQMHKKHHHHHHHHHSESKHPHQSRSRSRSRSPVHNASMSSSSASHRNPAGASKDPAASLPHHLAATEAAVTAAAQQQLLMEKFKLELQRYNLPGMPPMPAGFPHLPPTGADLAGYPFNLPVPPFSASTSSGAATGGLPPPPLIPSVSPSPSAAAAGHPPHMLSPNAMILQQQQTAMLKSMLSALPPGSAESAELMRMLAAAAGSGAPIPGLPNPLKSGSKHSGSPTPPMAVKAEVKKESLERQREADELSDAKRAKKPKLEMPSQSPVPFAKEEKTAPVEVAQAAEPVETAEPAAPEPAAPAEQQVQSDEVVPIEENAPEPAKEASPAKDDDEVVQIEDERSSSEDAPANALVIAEEAPSEPPPPPPQPEPEPEPEPQEQPVQEEPAEMPETKASSETDEERSELPGPATVVEEKSDAKVLYEEPYDESTNELEVDESHSNKFEEEPAANRAESVSLS